MLDFLMHGHGGKTKSAFEKKPPFVKNLRCACFGISFTDVNLKHPDIPKRNSKCFTDCSGKSCDFSDFFFFDFF